MDLLYGYTYYVHEYFYLCCVAGEGADLMIVSESFRRGVGRSLRLQVFLVDCVA